MSCTTNQVLVDKQPGLIFAGVELNHIVNNWFKLLPEKVPRDAAKLAVEMMG